MAKTINDYGLFVETKTLYGQARAEFTVIADELKNIVN